jgi:lysozyme family protein
MADFTLYWPKVRKWEGGFVNDPDDAGGATNMGVTVSTFRQWNHEETENMQTSIDELKAMSPDEAAEICKKEYWDEWQADEIENQSVAEELVEWAWGSGKWGIIIPQRALRLTADGIVGPMTINAVNNADQEAFFNLVRDLKIKFLDNLVDNHPEDQKFLTGWLNRINDFTYSE